MVLIKWRSIYRSSNCTFWAFQDDNVEQVKHWPAAVSHVCLGCSEHGSGARERSIVSPACTRMGFSVRLVWSRPSHRHSVESSGCTQCKCVWCLTFTFPHKRQTFNHSSMLLLQLVEFRQKMQSIFPAIPKNEDVQTNAAPFDWDSLFKSKWSLMCRWRELYVCSLDSRPVKWLPGQMWIKIPSTSYPKTV